MNTPALPATQRTGSPYKGLDYYQEQDAPFFFGREIDRDLVVANLLSSRLTLLYGQSGVGKSSLLHAGVAPRLREAPDLAVVTFRTWGGDPVTGLATAIRAAAGLEPQAGAIPLTDTIAASTGRLGRDLVVILDQFEEYFVYHPREDGDGTFAMELPRAVKRIDLPVSILISIREDALAQLDRFKGRIPNLFGNYLRIDRLDRKAACDAIARPLDEYGRRVADRERMEIEPELVEALLDQVKVGSIQIGDTRTGVIGGADGYQSRIEAPYLQLVLTRLWDEESTAGSHTLRLETLNRLGGAKRIVPEHLDATMAKLSREDRDRAARVFHFLVTPSGTKIAHNVPDLAAYADVPASELGPLLARLGGQEARILRGTGDGRYEIYHDVLAPAVLDWRARRLKTIDDERLKRRVIVPLLVLVLVLVLVVLVLASSL